MTDMSRYVRFAARCLTALIALSHVDSARAADDAPRLRLRSGDVETDPATSLLAELRAAGAPAGPDRYVIQLSGPITPARRAALTAAGVDVGEYLPDHAYFVDLRNVAIDDFAQLDFVLWIGRHQPQWKIDPEIGHTLAYWRTPERQAVAELGKIKITATLFTDADRAAAETAILAAGGEIAERYRAFAHPLFDVIIEPAQLAALADIPEIRFIEEAPEAAPRNSSVRWIVQSNQLNVLPLYAHGLTGGGQIVGIIDGLINTQHCAFADGQPIGPTHRKILAYNAIPGYDAHGTHVAGTVVGDAGFFDDTRGVAYNGRLVFSPINVTMTQHRLTLHHAQGARIHTNSWGNDATNLYDSLSRALDAFAHAFEDSLVLFAVSNLSTLRNPENAKNVLAVGATSDTPNQHQHCLGGSGPTLDGRRKPEIYAPGCGVNSSSGAGASCSVATDSGTSMACPATAGTAMLVRQYYTDGYYPSGAPIALDGFEPTAALVKATLLNSAGDLTGVIGYPSNLEGWGRVLADDALAFPGDSRRMWVHDLRNADGLNTGEIAEYPIAVTASTEKLKLTLVWTDPPPAPEASVIAVNDLNLEVIAPGGAVYRGNVFSGGVSVLGGTFDSVNNVEQVHVVAPQPGTWTVRIHAAEINDHAQGFALVATGQIAALWPAVRLQLLDEVPEISAPGAPLEVDVRVAPAAQTPVPEQSRLHIRFSSSDPFTAQPLTPLGGEVYRAHLPAGRCNEAVEFYFSASDGQTQVTLPANALQEFFRIAIGTRIPTFTDDFESDLGWSVSGDVLDGHWERGVPANGDRGDPRSDYDGSGKCYLTKNVAGNSDVDEGTTILTSPVLDVSQGGLISYAYWLADITSGALGTEDGLDVEFATNPAGTNWTLVRRYADALAAWRTDTIRVGEEIPKSATLRIRFLAYDLPPGDVLEAAVDAFRVERETCGPAGSGDFDGDGDLDLRDFAAFAACLPAPQPVSPTCAVGDMNGDAYVDIDDANAWVSRASGPNSPLVQDPSSRHNGSHNVQVREDTRANQSAP